MIGKEILLSDRASSSLARQLYKYYDLDCQEVVRVEELISSRYRVTYETERGFRWDIISMTVHRDCIEDLYVIVDGERVEPTTTKKEQELR